MSKFLIVGGGYIGSYLATKLPDSKLLTGYIGDEATLVNALTKEFPSHILINCAGKTGRPNIDWCEDNKDITFGANVGLPVMIAEVCKKLGLYWMHIGSGCIYDGYEKDFDEEDTPNFFGSFYARTKYWSQEILSEYAEACVLRIRMPIDENLAPRNYISKVVNYAREGKPIFNLLNSMTILNDLVEVIKFLAEGGETGEYNVVNNGSMVIGDILKIYKQYADPRLEWIEKEYSTVAKGLKAGRSNCIILPKKLEDKGFIMPELEGSVAKILKEYAEKKKGL